MEGLRQKVQPNFSTKKLGYPDVILVSLGSMPAINYVPGLAKFLLEGGTPFVILCQFNSDSLPMTAKEREMTRRLLVKSSRQVFVSEQNLNLARRQFALNLANAEVVFNPIRTVLEEPLKFPDFKNGIEFACVARFETLWKGQDLLVEILSKQPWIDREWSLHFYGEGPDFDHVQNYVKLLGLEERVIFEGYVRNVLEIWNKCHAMVLPSRGEGTPLAVLEAMMCGRIAITTDVGGNAEIVEDGVNGWIAEAATPQSFGNALERAWKACSKWKEMGETAHEKAKQLSNNRPAEKLLEVIQEVKKFYT
jgi:glycosyltransferase involved in cell wall biosynthesis